VSDPGGDGGDGRVRDSGAPHPGEVTGYLTGGQALAAE
jgi:hypothetical protein